MGCHADMSVCNVKPLIPHCYRIKLGFTWVFIISLFFALKHRMCVHLRTASRLPTIYVWNKNNMKNIQIFQHKNFIFTDLKIAAYVNTFEIWYWHVCVMLKCRSVWLYTYKQWRIQRGSLDPPFETKLFH